jgi:hypothetical protein
MFGFPTASLSQGNRFQKRFQAARKSTEGFADRDINRTPFEQYATSELKESQPTHFVEDTNTVLANTKGVLQGSHDTLPGLKTEYENTLKEYNDLKQSYQDQASSYVSRVDPNNPYIRRIVIFTTGHVCYVTKMGFVKYIPTGDIWNAVINNGCVKSSTPIYLDIPWLNSYAGPGIPIPTTPPLVSGSFATEGCGNEGESVFVNSISNNPTMDYLGCYNNLPPATEILFSPTTMTATNTVNGYSAYASSVYYDYNELAGPWCVFDNNVDTWWANKEESSYAYDWGTGEYLGDNKIVFTDTNGSVQDNVRGEFLILLLSAPTILTKYEIQGRVNMPERDPNTWYILGDNNGWFEVDYRSEVSLNGKLNAYTVSKTNQAYSQYAILITKVGCPTCPTNNGHNTVQLATWNLYTNSSYSANNNNSTPAMTQTSSNSISFDQCSQYAIENGYNTFALQNAQSDGTGICMVGKDATKAQMYGEAFGYPATNLWSTYTNDGVSAVVNNYGSIQVLNSSNKVVYSSPATEATPPNYFGCYQDNEPRGLPGIVDNYAIDSDMTTCSALAKDGDYKYFGLQATNWNGDGKSQCYLGNDLTQAMTYGKATTCQSYDGYMGGGGWTNALYSTNPETGSKYYLLLQDDGNLCMFRGSGPTDNQGLIWGLNDSWGKNKDPNPLFSATKGKYGRNYMVSGESLNVNEFIGSTDGSMYLMMMPGGDLQLNTTSKASSCTTMSGKNVGGSLSNAVYQFNQPGIKSFMQLLGFVDGDSVLYTYDSADTKYTNEYNKIDNMDSGGNDIPGAAFSNANVEQCKSTCNQNADCAGFAFDNNNSVCWPKTNGMYPVGSTQILPGTDIYTRNKAPTQPPIGSNTDVANIDTIAYNNYTKSSDPVPSVYGLGTALNSTQRDQLSQLEDKLNQLSSQINSYTTTFSNSNNNVNNQSTTNEDALKDYVDEMGITKDQIKVQAKDNVTMNNIQNEYNLVTLQNNYRYIFWTLLVCIIILLFLHYKPTN